MPGSAKRKGTACRGEQKLGLTGQYVVYVGTTVVTQVVLLEPVPVPVPHR